MNKPDR